MADRLDLPSRHRRVLDALLGEHLPDVEVWAYGSRVNGRCHDGSDLDLVFRGPGSAKVSDEQIARFSDAMRESTIPFLVEGRDWARLPEPVRREIGELYVVLRAPRRHQCP
ncbi:MAG: nucleotidyltransferase domain-containing protein [Pseudomonadales bacterium]|nr:nucleotidyltransferase domain-containing protein [Pseudomonadales bacterium]